MDGSLQNQPSGDAPPKVWTQSKAYGGAFDGSNRAMSGATRAVSLWLKVHAVSIEIDIRPPVLRWIPG